MFVAYDPKSSSRQQWPADCEKGTRCSTTTRCWARARAKRKRKYRLKGGGYVYDLPGVLRWFSRSNDQRTLSRATVRQRRRQAPDHTDGYQWNGADFFPDHDWILRASLVHDALCQLLDKGTWNPTDGEKGKRGYRRCADRELFCIVRADKGRGWAKLTYSAVRGYAKGWVPGGLVGGLFGVFRRTPTFDCGAEVSTSPPRT